MRLIFVNHCHPDCPHVCATRAREFANALAHAGHRIVLLTETLRRDDAAIAPQDLGGALDAHDWRAPFRLACRPRPAAVLERLRAGRLPAISKPIVAYQYLLRGGMATDWRDASRSYWQVLADMFRPDVAWGVFGNTDAWAIAQGIARLAGCPWVRDLKDEWTGFIPALVRTAVARRFSDAAATTALSQANADNAAPWLPGAATVVYSGVPAELVAAPVGGPDPAGPFVITLVGAVYDRDSLETFATGIGRFLDAADRGRVRLVYAGADVELARSILDSLSHRLDLQIRGQLPFSSYWDQVCRSRVNVYVRLKRVGWWHHKIAELLAARRPILCCPGEIQEAEQLTQSVGGELHHGGDAAEIANVLTELWERRRAPQPVGRADSIAGLTWEARAAGLAAVFAQVKQAD